MKFINPVVTNDTNAILANVTGISGMREAVYTARIVEIEGAWYVEFYGAALGEAGRLSVNGNGDASDWQPGFLLRGTVVIANFESIAEDLDIVITWQAMLPSAYSVGTDDLGGAPRVI